jgi:hypothetical protein
MATLAVTNSFSAGTTIVAADMNQNFDDVELFINTTPGVVQEDIVDAVGDILHGDAADSVGKLTVGTNNHVLTADSTVTNVGIKWAAVPAPTTITVADTTDATCFVGVFESATGDLAPKTDGALLYNASTGSLEATVFTGPLTGLASSATTAGACTGNSATATTAGTVTTAAQGAITSVGTLTGLTLSGAVVAADQVVGEPQLKDYSETVEDISGTKTAAFDIALADGNVQTLTVGSGTFNIGIVGALTDQSNSLTLLLTNGGASTATFVAGANGGGGNAVHWAGGEAPTFTTSGVDVVCFTSFDGGTNFYGFVGGLDMSIPS